MLSRPFCYTKRGAGLEQSLPSQTKREGSYYGSHALYHVGPSHRLEDDGRLQVIVMIRGTGSRQWREGSRKLRWLYGIEPFSFGRYRFGRYLVHACMETTAATDPASHCRILTAAQLAERHAEFVLKPLNLKLPDP